MALGRARRFEAVNYWPGFVDALSTMLLVIIFLLSVFMLAQFFLSREVTGKDTALQKLNQQIEELTSLLAMERSAKSADEGKIAYLSATLASAEKEQEKLKATRRRAAPAPKLQRRARARRPTRSRRSGRSRSARWLKSTSSISRSGFAQAARRDPGRARRLADFGTRVAGQDRRPRAAPQRRARPEGAGAFALPLRLLRPTAADPGLASRHPGGRRPFRVRILGAV